MDYPTTTTLIGATKKGKRFHLGCSIFEFGCYIFNGSLILPALRLPFVPTPDSGHCPLVVFVEQGNNVALLPFLQAMVSGPLDLGYIILSRDYPMSLWTILTKRTMYKYFQSAIVVGGARFSSSESSTQTTKTPMEIAIPALQ